MPGSRTKLTTSSKPAPARRRSFRQQYDELEARRAELCGRLGALGQAAQAHPAFKGALTLLNNVYRREKLAQRLAVLQSAAWLISILERLASTL
jgi:predicted RNA polymerase sigma factor